MTTRPLTAAAVVALATALSSAAHAVVCTGTTMALGNGGVAQASFLLGTGNCVAVSDKVFGQFSSSGAITGNGAASFTFAMSPGNVTIGFLGTVAASSTGGINYTVAVDPALSQGFLIENLEKDFTLNASLTGLPASATLTGSTTADPSFTFNCTRTVNPPGGTCPQTDVFGLVSQMTVNQTITTSPNAIVTALTDTISQARPVPEPSSLALLGAGLVGLGIMLRRHKRRPKENFEHCAV